MVVPRASPAWTGSCLHSLDRGCLHSLDRRLPTQSGQEAAYTVWTGGCLHNLDRRLPTQSGQEAAYTAWTGDCLYSLDHRLPTQSGQEATYTVWYLGDNSALSKDNQELNSGVKHRTESHTNTGKRRAGRLLPEVDYRSTLDTRHAVAPNSRRR